MYRTQPILTLAATVKSVTAAQVARLAAVELAPDREVIVARGPERAVEALRKSGWVVQRADVK